MKLTCPDCQKQVPAADVNIKLGVGKCAACDAVFSLADQVGTPMRSLRNELPLAPPKQFRIDDFGPDLTITWRWYAHAVWFMLVFAIFWDGFLLVWYSAAIGQLLAGRSAGGVVWFMLLFPILHLAVGVAITYGVLLAFFNRTEIKLASGELAITHGPLPFWGNCRVASSEIAQLFCTEKTHRRKHGYSHTYSLMALRTSGERMNLIDNIQESCDAIFLERFLEEKLKIANRSVPGEYKG